MSNILFDIDSYKASHWLQYPPNTTNAFFYLESRGGDFDETVFFGLDALLADLEVPSWRDVAAAQQLYKVHGVPFNADGWFRLIQKYPHRLPLHIRSVPEGTVVPTGNVLMTVETTDPEFFWLGSWVETYLMRVWYPTTVATLSRAVKKVVWKYLDETCDVPLALLPSRLHDFGSRGVSSAQSAAYGGAAHLVSFQGSDTFGAIQLIGRVYGEVVAGYSIPAAEHSTITSWGRNGECAAYSNMLDQFAKPGAILAVVSDSYDLDNALDRFWCSELKQKVIDSGAIVVIRPDSGNPTEQVLKCLTKLEQAYGKQTNDKGYAVLNHVRVIQGDGINRHSIEEICQSVKAHGYSLENVAFGMGGGLLQQVNRDTLKFAYKCSSVVVDGVQRDVFKDPVGEPFKRSKAGRLDLQHTDEGYQTVVGPSLFSVLETAYLDGKIRETSFDKVRRRAELPEVVKADGNKS